MLFLTKETILNLNICQDPSFISSNKSEIMIKLFYEQGYISFMVCIY